MTRTALTRLPLFAVVFGLAFAASAQTATTAATQDEVSANTAAPAADADKLIEAKKDMADGNCLKQTGSRITPRPDKQGRKCVNAPGRSYSKDDLDRTGATDIADALRMLDPSVR